MSQRITDIKSILTKQPELFLPDKGLERSCPNPPRTLPGRALKMLTTAGMLWLTALASTGAGAQNLSTVPYPYANGRPLFTVGLPFQANPFRAALPGIFDQAGHERRTLSGTVTVDGSAVPFVFVRELDQRVRLDLGMPARTLMATGLDLLTAPQLQTGGGESLKNEAEILETLAEDAPESLHFIFGTAARITWLGGGYNDRESHGNSADVPLYDIYARTGVAGTQQGAPERTKSFFFDSSAKLLSLTRYDIERDGSTVNVEVSFGGWTSLSGQMIPTTIIRSENGAPVFTITINAASSSATQTDSLFTL